MQVMQKIVTHPWFNDNVEQAVKLYSSFLTRLRTISIAFHLEGQMFKRLNGDPSFSFTPPHNIPLREQYEPGGGQ
jgi:predicted 3-demethylubiquinone-9 3-methyltransferase (glyoxalase superfamily)